VFRCSCQIADRSTWAVHRGCTAKYSIVLDPRHEGLVISLRSRNDASRTSCQEPENDSMSSHRDPSRGHTPTWLHASERA
jgi:hypothetical protein